MSWKISNDFNLSKKGIYKNLCNHRLLDGVDDVGDVVEASGLVGGCHHVDGTQELAGGLELKS